jgi:hypothetical protein
MTLTTTDMALEKEVTSFIIQSLRFVRENDARAMETVFAEEYSLVLPTGDVMDKKQLIAIYRSGDMRQVSLQVEGLQVHTYDQVAIVRAQYHSEFEFKGQPIKQSFLRTDIVVKAAGEFKFVTSHTTQNA